MNFLVFYCLIFLLVVVWFQTLKPIVWIIVWHLQMHWEFYQFHLLEELFLGALWTFQYDEFASTPGAQLSFWGCQSQCPRNAFFFPVLELLFLRTNVFFFLDLITCVGGVYPLVVTWENVQGRKYSELGLSI